MIRLDHIGKSFGSRTVLSDVSVELEPASHLVVRGSSGSGKTTLLRIIAGLELPDAGRVELDGKLASDPTGSIAPHERSIGFAFQTPALWPHMTVGRNVAFPLQTRTPGAGLAEVIEGLELGGLVDKLPHQLSGGEARRVSIARAIVAKPARMLLDEPLTHLDADRQRGVLDFVLDHAERSGSSLIVVTHSEAETERIGGQVLSLAAGRSAT